MDDLDIFIQGSHKNNTITYGGGDVDVVVKLESTYYRGLDRLPAQQAELYREHHDGDVNYDDRDLRNDIIRALRVARVAYENGRKAIQIPKKNNRLAFGADIVPCCEYRWYEQYEGQRDSEQAYTPGIAFKTNDSRSRLVVNYPKQHYEQGTDKNGQTNGNYKETVRLFKNARDKAVEEELITKEVAPSYFIECLLYSVPDDRFDRPVRQRYPAIMNWLQDNRHQWSGFKSQNDLLPLFGDDPDLWSRSDAHEFVNGLVILWNDWHTL